MLESSMIRSLKDVQKMRTESGGDGSEFVKSPRSVMTPILMEYLQVKPPRSSEPSLKYIESLSPRSKESFVESVKSRWQDRLLELPRGIGKEVPEPSREVTPAL
jgi:hypothetical protein